MDWFPDRWTFLLQQVGVRRFTCLASLPLLNATLFSQTKHDSLRTVHWWKHLASLTYYLGVNYLTEAKWIQKWLIENFGYCAEVIPNGLDETIFYPDYPICPKGHDLECCWK